MRIAPSNRIRNGASVREVNLQELLVAASVSCIYDGIKLMQISRYTLFVCRGISYKIAKRYLGSELKHGTSDLGNMQSANHLG